MADREQIGAVVGVAMTYEHSLHETGIDMFQE